MSQIPSPQDRDAAGPGRGWRSAEIAILVVAMSTLLLSCAYHAPYTVDDCFISLRYARHLATGEGLVYNVGERVEGFSNFSLVALEALWLRLGVPVLPALKITGAASALLTAALTLQLARRSTPEGSTARWVPALALVLFAVNASVAVWSQSGLETSLYALLVLSMCLRFDTEQRLPGSRPWSALLLGFAWMTRPETPIYLLYFAVRRLASRRGFDRRDVAWLGLLAALVVPYELFGYLYFGDWLPHTYTAKAGGGEWIPRPVILRRFLFQQGVGFGVLLAGGLVGNLLRPRPSTTTVVPLVCGLILVLHAGADWMPRHRLLVPVLPFLLVLAARGWGQLADLAPSRRAWRFAVLAGALVATVESTRHQWFEPYPHGPRTSATAPRPLNWWAEIPEAVGRVDYPMEATAWDVLRLVPAHETICARDIGFVGWLSGNPIHDLAGLMTPTAARARNERTPEAMEALREELVAREPALILLTASAFQTELGELLVADPRIQARYEIGKGRRRRTFRRRDLTPFDVTTRVEAALDRFPSYRARAATFASR